MDCFKDYYEQLDRLSMIPHTMASNNDNFVANELTVDISDSRITQDFFDKVEHYTSMLVLFFE